MITMLKRGLVYWRSLTTMAKMLPKEPLVVVIGATGTGKSKVVFSGNTL